MKVQVTIEMVLHTIIGEYDVLYAQERELCGFFSDKPEEAFCTDPAAHLSGTVLPHFTAQPGFPVKLTNEQKKRRK